MNKSTVRKIRISAAIALILSICVSLCGFEAACDEVRGSVLRLHILANSNSLEDQALKLKVKDAVAKFAEKEFADCSSLEQAMCSAEEKIGEIEQIAARAVKENGFAYNVSAEVKKEYFETRIYDEFTIPAGVYNSLIIKIGQAKGKNWWCVLFPSLCVSAALDDAEKYMGNKPAMIIKNSNKFQLRFKIIEYYQNLKKIISK